MTTTTARKSDERLMPRLLNDISDEDRAKFDTLGPELNCVYEFCPWTPTDKIKGIFHNVFYILIFFCFRNIGNKRVFAETT